MSDTIHLATQTPAGIKYNPNKGYVQRRSLSTRIYAAKPQTAAPKSRVGPGAYEDDKAAHGLKTAVRRQKMARSTEREIFGHLKEKKKVPGVGQYSLDASKTIYKGPVSRHSKR